MDQAIKQQWVAALRSGDYQQAHGYLRTEAGYCCLGVLCDLKDATKWHKYKKNDQIWLYSSDPSSEFTVLPQEVVEWAGLDSDNPIVRSDTAGIANLATLNDGDHDFIDIANIIEEQL